MFTQLTAAVSGLSSDGVDIRGEIVQSAADVPDTTTHR